MKLRNKKTGEIVSFIKVFNYDSLAELNDEWEDVSEEPKHDYYFIRDGGNIDCHWYQNLGEITERRKEIGNYFETKEEAEKAVEKLKAWKRLKDKGLRPSSSSICGDDFVASFKLTNHIDYQQSIDDFDCIFDFRGEE